MTDQSYLLMKRGLFYRPNAQGYTGIRDEAGRYTEAEALARSRAGADGVTMVLEAEAPEFTSACYDDLARDHLTQQRDEALARATAAEAERDEAQREAVALAISLWRTHYRDDAPQWEPLGTPSGVISQIDNMVAGIIDRATAAEARVMEAFEQAARIADAMQAKIDARLKKLEKPNADLAGAAADVAAHHATAVRKRIAELELQAFAPPPEPNYEVGTVYVAGYGPYVKIGFTSGPVEARLAGISTPLPFNIYGTFPNATRALERELHARFAHQRLNGEWFHLSADVAKWIKRRCPL